jgi:hypothetical protein
MTQATAPMFAVIYDDPKRKTGASHSLHAAGCGDVARAARRRDDSGAHTLNARTVAAAVIEAQYQGFEPDERSNLGDVEPAPCTKRLPAA